MGQEIIFAKHRSNGFIVDLVRDGLGFSIENIRGVDKKDWERLRNEDNITSDKYAEVLDKVCRAIVREIFSIDDGQESKKDLENLSFFNALTKELLGYYSQYKSYFETLGAGQKQLDFITISIFFVPFVAHAVSDSTTSSERDFKTKPFLIDRILPSDSKTSIMKVFELIEYDLAQNNPQKELRALIKEIFDNLKETNYDGINKNINNWLNGKNPPKLENIKHIAKVGKHCKDLSCRRIEIYLKLARIIQFAYDRACKYFGVDLANLLVEHFRLVTLLKWQQFTTKDYRFFEAIINEIGKKLPESTFAVLCNYLDYYFSNPFFDFFLHKHIEMEGKYSKELNQQEKEYFGSIQDFITLMTQMNEKGLFENLDFFIPVRYFVPQNPNDFDTNNYQKYFEMRIESFLNPFEVKILTKEQLECQLNKDFLEYAQLTRDLFPLTLPTREKQIDDEVNFGKILQQIQRQYDISQDPYICFMQARFYAQKLELDKANEFYLKALKYGKNVMGRNFRATIKEGLMISALLADKDSVDLNNTKSDFTKFYKEAYFLNLITDLPNENHFAKHFLLDEQKKFDRYFCYLYPQNQTNDSKNTKGAGILADKKRLKLQKKIQKHQNSEFISITPNMYITSKEQLQNISIDFENPNKILTQYPNPITQLMYCCSLGDIESVKKLLAKGADINILEKSDNASVLHHCIDGILPFSLTPQHIELAKLLIPKCSIDTLNARCIKKKETILSRCIERGLVELVELLIENGVDLESKTCSGDDMSPLYWCIWQIAFAKGKMIGFDDAMNDITENQIKTLMSHRSNATFDDEYIRDFEKQKEVMRQNYDCLLETQEALKFYHKQNLPKYYEIFDLLIEYCNVNTIQENLYNFTPLIYAAKIDEPILVKKLLAKGADKTLTLDDGRTAYHYAQKNHNLELMMLLRE